MSKKQKVMEALLTSDVNLNSEDLIWISSNLPSDDTMGDYRKVYNFNHKRDDLFGSINLSHENAKKIAEIFSEATKNALLKDNYYLSNAVEYVLNNASDIEGFYPLIVSKVLREGIETFTNKVDDASDAIKSLTDLLKIMKDKPKDDQD